MTNTSGEPVTVPGPQGLRGVVVTDTTIGEVRGAEGFYHYRQYSAIELAKERPLEDVWQLLLEGQLPTTAEAVVFAAKLATARPLPGEVAAGLGALSAHVGNDSLSWLRSAVSVFAGAEGFAPILDLDADQLHEQSIRLIAGVPTLVAAVHRAHLGLAPVPPDASLSTAENYLYMLSGSLPEPALAKALEQYLVATADHGFNASTFTARVVASTGADLGSAIVAAIGALSGPLHGGAPRRVLELLDGIAPGECDAFAHKVLGAGGRIMGFGHAVYQGEDPRCGLLREVARSLGGKRVELAEELEGSVRRAFAELKGGREINANVELYAAVVLEACGLPRDLLTATFAISRMGGWCAHVIEQAAEGRLVRPTARYVGPRAPTPVPPRG